MGAPIDNSAHMVATRWARNLTDAQLATQIESMGRLTGVHRKATIAEAARRIRWGNPSKVLAEESKLG